MELDVPSEGSLQAHAVHVVASDGTGGYAGKRIRILTARQLPALPDGWHATVFGLPPRAGTVRWVDSSVMISAFGGTIRGRSRSGLWVCRPAEESVDLAVRVTGLEIEGAAARLHGGLVFQSSLEDFAPAAMVYGERKPAEDRARMRFACRPRAGWKGSRVFAPTGVVESADISMRLVRRGKNVAGYVRHSDGAWRQVGMAAVPSAAAGYVGVAATGGVVTDGEEHPARARCEWLSPEDAGLPVLEVKAKGKAPKGKQFAAPAKVVVHAAPDTVSEGEYAVAGTTNSFDCGESLALGEAGLYRLTVRSSRDGATPAAVTFLIDLGESR
jgi:hypothetical protein